VFTIFIASSVVTDYDILGHRTPLT
jgi:hypothetical protein